MNAQPIIQLACSEKLPFDSPFSVPTAQKTGLSDASKATTIWNKPDLREQLLTGVRCTANAVAGMSGTPKPEGTWKSSENEG